MTDKKISAFDPADPLLGDEIAVVDQDGTTVRTTAQEIADLRVIQPDEVTNARLANMAAARMKGRALGAGTGDPQDLTPEQIVAMIRSATLRFSNRTANGPRALGNGRALQYIDDLDRMLIFEASGTLRLLEIDRYTDHLVPRFTATGKVPGSWCYAESSALIWASNGATNIFAVDPAGWTNPISGAAARCDYLLYAGGTRDRVYGFDKSGTPAIREINPSTGAGIAATTTGLANSLSGGGENPWAYVPAVDCIYLADLFGGIRKFDCTTTTVSLISAVTAFGSGIQALLLGSDGLLYIVSSIGTDKQKITVLNPATDTVVTTIDLSSHLYSSTIGFTSITENQGYLYASMSGTESSVFGCVVVVRLSDYAVVGSLTPYGAAGRAVGYPGIDRMQVAISPFNASNINAFER